METKTDIVAKYMKNLRMISISPFANAEPAADKCRGRFVYAWKPQPSYLVHWDETAMEKELVTHVKSASGCSLTINMMDAYYFGKDTTRYRRWVQMVKKVIDKHYRITC